MPVAGSGSRTCQGLAGTQTTPVQKQVSSRIYICSVQVGHYASEGYVWACQGCGFKHLRYVYATTSMYSTASGSINLSLYSYYFIVPNLIITFIF